MEFSFQDTKVLHKIKVFGIGGGGNNAINNMIEAGISGPLFVAANSDMQDLERNLAPHKVQVGTQLTKGLGCGGKAEVGRAAAMEDIDRIKDMLADSDMVFITAGMGGGTGSGGAPVVAEALSKLSNPPLIVGVVTKPFAFEGKGRMKQAQESIKELMGHCHSIITVPNEKLLSVMPKGGTLKEAYRLADEVLMKAVQGITDMITGKGMVNVDFQDLKTVMSKRGPTIMGLGQSTGEDRALKAAQQAISSPLLDDLSIKGAQGILINITCGEDLKLDEVQIICDLVNREADEEAEIFHGVTMNSELDAEGLLKVMVIATGLEHKGEAAADPKAGIPGPNPKDGSDVVPFPAPSGKPGARPRDIHEGDKRRTRLADLYNQAPPDPDTLEEPAFVRFSGGVGRYGQAAQQLGDDLLLTPTYLRRKAD